MDGGRVGDQQAQRVRVSGWDGGWWHGDVRYVARNACNMVVNVKLIALGTSFRKAFVLMERYPSASEVVTKKKVMSTAAECHLK